MLKNLTRFGAAVAFSFCATQVHADLIDTGNSGYLHEVLENGGVTLYEYSESENDGFYNWYSIENNSLGDIGFFAVTTGDPNTYTGTDTWHDPSYPDGDGNSSFTEYWDTGFYSQEDWDSEFGSQYGRFSSLFGETDDVGVNWYAFQPDWYYDAANLLGDEVVGTLRTHLIESGKTYGTTSGSPFQFFGSVASEFVAFDIDNVLLAQSANATAVPAPASLSIFALGLLGLGASRRVRHSFGAKVNK